MDKNKTRITLIFTVLISGLLFFVIGVTVGRNQIVCQYCQPEEVNFSLFWETWDKLKSAFYDPDKINEQEMVYGAIKGMVGSLNDPYTVFLDPEDSKRFIEDAQGRFEGVGMEIGIKNQDLKVIAPLKGTPAEKAGIKAGDGIVKIDGKITVDITIEEAVNLIRGPRGTTVKLTIFRNEWSETKDFEIKRAVIEIPSVEWTVKETDGQKIAYIQLYQFSEKAGFDFRRVADEIINSGSQKIILDLRNNPGGYLEISQDIAGWFLERGKTVVVEDRGGLKEKKEYKAIGNNRLGNYPLVVLINNGSASASEILAGALRDQKGAQLVGKTSFGKGSVQKPITLSDGSFLKVTIARWLTPSGYCINEMGLEPDVTVEMPEEETEEDFQLEKAIEVLENIR